jgi:hypothetical protein
MINCINNLVLQLCLRTLRQAIQQNTSEISFEQEETKPLSHSPFRVLDN